jgi:predicted GNAT family N-acyltransferase
MTRCSAVACWLKKNRKQYGCARWLYPNDLQGKGVGRALIQFAENLARDHGYHKITMHARKNALGFYEKMGYRVKGSEFEEITIPHYIMEKDL